MKKTLLGPTLAALAAVVLFSTGGLSIKWLPLTALQIAGIRAGLAALFIGVYLSKRTGKSFFPAVSRDGKLAAAGYVIMTVTYVASMKLTTAANSIFLQYTMPAWVLLGGALWLKESITYGRLATIALSFSGMFLFFMDELSPQQGYGNGLALISGVGYAVVVLSIRKDRDCNPVAAVFWGNAVTAVLVIPLSLYLAPETLGHLSNGWALLVLLWLGVFQIGLAYILFVNSLKSLPAIEVAILSMIEPVLNPLWVFLVLDERPGRWAIAGGAVILLSVLMRNLMREKETIEPTK